MDWLRREPVLAALGEQAARLASLQAALDRCAPGLNLTVIALDRDTVVVGTRHAAQAARLRQTLPTLVAGLNQAGWPVNQIRIRPRWQSEPARPPRLVREGPNAGAVASLRTLSESVTTPALKTALARLVARHTPKASRP